MPPLAENTNYNMLYHKSIKIGHQKFFVATVAVLMKIKMTNYLVSCKDINVWYTYFVKKKSLIMPATKNFCIEILIDENFLWQNFPDLHYQLSQHQKIHSAYLDLHQLVHHQVLTISSICMQCNWTGWLFKIGEWAQCQHQYSPH